MADCSKFAFNINISDLAYNSSLGFSVAFPDLVGELLKYFSPFPKLPGNVELPPIPELSAISVPTDIIQNLLDKLPPIMGALAPLFAVMGLIKCIINVLCAMPNPWKTIRAILKLFRDCLPAFLIMLPPFYIPILIITIIRLVIALVALIIECILSTIEAIVEVYYQLVELIDQLSEGGMTAYAAIVKLACGLGNKINTCFGPISILDPIFSFVAPFLGLAESSIVFDWSWGCLKGDVDGEACPPADEMARFIEAPNDPAGFSFNPSTVPMSCYPEIQSQIRLMDVRYGKVMVSMPNLPNTLSVYNDLSNFGALLTPDGTENINPDAYVNKLGTFIDNYVVRDSDGNIISSGEPFLSRLNQFKEDMRCTLYSAASNTLDRFTTTFTAQSMTAVADGENYILLTVTPKDVAGNDIGPIGYGDIESPYMVVFSTDLGDIYDIQEEEDGSFTAKIKSSSAGTATICAYMMCNICVDTDGDGIPDTNPNDPGGNGGDSDGYEVIGNYKIATKSVDGTIITHTVSSIKSFLDYHKEIIPLAGIVEIPALDGYDASTYEVDEEQKCISVVFTQAEEILVGGTIGKCE